MPYLGWYLYNTTLRGWLGWTHTLIVFYAIFVTLTSFFFYRKSLSWRQIEQHHLFVCPDCEYPLHQLSDPGICPECGRPYSFREIQAYWIDVETGGGEERKNPYRRQK